MAEQFKFTRHKRKFDYLSNTNSIQLGNGYSFTSGANGPMLKKFTLRFTGFRYYYDNNGVIDHEAHKYENNIAALCDFYETMNMNTAFIYNDEQFGAVNVRFEQPFSVPETKGPNAVVDDFELVLQEVSR